MLGAMFTAAGLALLTAAPALPQVDPDVKPLRPCAPSFVSFRDEQVGWLGTRCGGILRTEDGGRSWRRDAALAAQLMPAGDVSSDDALPDGRKPRSEGLRQLSHLLWLSPTEGLALGYGAAVAFRTEDGGRGWTRITLPVSQWPYDAEVVGERVWTCGSEGRILRSDDAGRTWKELPGTPFNRDDRCIVLSFVDERDGWAGGMNGSLWHSTDGGETWARMDSPDPRPAIPREDFNAGRSWRELVRITPQLAWGRMDAGRFRTLDGGKTWERLTPLSERVKTLRPVVVRQGVRLPWVAHARGETEDASALEPLLEEASPWGARGVVTEDLRFFQEGALVRSGPPLSAGGSRRVTLEGIERTADRSWGWAGDLVFQTQDGEHWFAVGKAPKPVTRLAALTSGVLLARSGAGELLRSDDGGERWLETESPLDARDFAARVGAPVPMVLAPDCVLSARPATLTVRFGVNGCFGGTESTLKLELGEQKASAEVRLDQGTEAREKSLRSLAPGQARAAMEALVQAALRTELPSSCSTTTETFATLEWTCGAGGRKGGPVALSTNSCDPRGFDPAVGGATSAGAITPDFYSRPIGVAHEARRIAEELLKSP